ncbi:MAG TPA: hypothetical protein VFW92_02020 [Candidatus Limnocylindrales bacterium]|nr:hypothetical protein [Candidatus Limnocylindrales bacterium]
MAGWWATKVRQTWRHLSGRLTPAERAALDAWLTEPQRQLFATMHPADQRHGLDVVTALRAAGHDEPDLLLAGLFHDAAKGPQVRLVHRVAWSLGEHYGPAVRSAAARLPGFGAAFERIADHPERSATLALAAGCSPLTADLIRHQAAPDDPVLGQALLLADEAS